MVEKSVISNILDKWFNSYVITIVYFLVALLYCCGPAMPLADEMLNVVLLAIACNIVWLFFNKKLAIKKYYFYTIPFLIWAYISILVNGISSLNLKVSIYYFVLCLYIPNCWNYINKKKGISNFFRILQLLGFVILIPSIIVYYSGYYHVFTNDVTDMGLIFGRHPNGALYGILCNSNWTSFFCLLVIGASLYLLYEKKNILSLFSLILSFYSLILTSSRGGLIGFFVFISVFSLFYFMKLNAIKEKKFNLMLFLKPLLKTIGVIVLLAVSVILFQKVNSIIYSQVDLLRNPITNDVVISDEVNEVANEENMNTGVRSDEEKESSNNVRLELWKTGLTVVKQYPIFGVSEQNLSEKILENSISGDIETDLSKNLHNIYVQIMTTTGVPGLIFWLLAIIIPLIKGILVYLKAKSFDMGLLVSGSLIAGILCINLFEADIMSRNFMGISFWMLMGYVASVKYTENNLSNEIE
jgi:hypothetical protein